MTDVVDSIRQIVRHELAQRPTTLLGVVERVRCKASAQGPENYDCDVRLRGRDVVLAGVPLATPHLGSVATPAEGDLVLLAFVAGDADRPVVIGRLYSEALRPPDFAAAELVGHCPPAVAPADQVQWSVSGGSNGKRVVTLALPDDVRVRVQDARIEVTAGKLQVVLDEGAGEATVTTDAASIVLDDGGGIRLKADGDIEISAAGNLTLKANGNTTIESTGPTEIKGSPVNVN